MKHAWDKAAPYTYFLECDGHGLIKIGCSAKGVHLRIRALQQGSPFSLVCIGMIAGDETTEAKMHQKFKAHRFRNEWFYDCADIRSFLDEACPQFDYGITEFQALRFDLSAPLKEACRFNLDAKEALKEICEEADVKYWDIYPWINGTAYATEKAIWCAEQFLARGCDKIQAEKRTYSTAKTRAIGKKKVSA